MKTKPHETRRGRLSAGAVVVPLRLGQRSDALFAAIDRHQELLVVDAASLVRLGKAAAAMAALEDRIREGLLVKSGPRRGKPMAAAARERFVIALREATREWGRAIQEREAVLEELAESRRRVERAQEALGPPAEG